MAGLQIRLDVFEIYEPFVSGLPTLRVPRGSQSNTTLLHRPSVRLATCPAQRNLRFLCSSTQSGMPTLVSACTNACNDDASLTNTAHARRHQARRHRLNRQRLRRHRFLLRQCQIRCRMSCAVLNLPSTARHCSVYLPLVLRDSTKASLG